MSLSYSQVKQLVKDMEKLPAAEITFEHKGLKLYLRKNIKTEPRPRTLAKATTDRKIKPRHEHAGLLPVNAPMMGIFCAARVPSLEPFVQVGQQVSDGTEVGIVEVTGGMNITIKSPAVGVIAQIVVANGEAIKLGQTLMWIDP